MFVKVILLLTAPARAVGSQRRRGRPRRRACAGHTTAEAVDSKTWSRRLCPSPHATRVIPKHAHLRLGEDRVLRVGSETTPVACARFFLSKAFSGAA
jgi:hypothetical protein